MFREADRAGRSSRLHEVWLMVKRGARDSAVVCHGALSEWKGSNFSASRLVWSRLLLFAPELTHRQTKDIEFRDASVHDSFPPSYKAVRLPSEGG